MSTRIWGSRVAALLCAAAGLLPLAVLLPAQTHRFAPYGGAALAALALAAAAALCAFGRIRFAGPLLAIAAGLSLVVKPLLYPIMSEWRGESSAHSFTAETHLYYVVPGSMLCVLGAGLSFARRSEAPVPSLAARIGAAAVASVTGALLLLFFFGGSGEGLAVATQLLPGLGVCIAGVAILARGDAPEAAGALPPGWSSPWHGPVATGPAPGWPAPGASGASGDTPWAATGATGELLRAVAHAPPIAPSDARAQAGGLGEPLGPAARIGPFQLIERLGAGGMGVVYRARDERLLRDVALKLLPPHMTHDPERRERLLREARAAARINHPSVAAIYEVSNAPEGAFIAMELAQGATLRALLASRSLSPAEAPWLALRIAEGLAAAHAQGVVHRDLKPENVVIAPDRSLKILDFGLARLEASPYAETLDVAVADAFRTRDGQLLGTPAYMSPEQALGESAQAPSDVFSFGVLLFEMLTGRMLFARATLAETRRAIIERDLAGQEPVLRMLSPPLAQVLMRCLEQQPQGRFPDAGALATALAAALR